MLILKNRINEGDFYQGSYQVDQHERISEVLSREKNFNNYFQTEKYLDDLNYLPAEQVIPMCSMGADSEVI